MRTHSLSALAVAVTVSIVVVGCGSGGPTLADSTSPADSAPSATPTESVTPTTLPRSQTSRPVPTAPPLPDYVVAVIEVGRDPGYAEVAFGSVWVGNHHGDSISRIDPATNTVTATIEVPGEPTGLTAAFGSLWTFTPIDQMLKRVDPATNAVVGSLALDDHGGSITGVQELDGSLWFAGDGGQIQRIDPVGLSVLATLDMAADCAGSLAASAGLLWYAPLCGDDGVAMIDPAGPSVKGTVPVAGANAVWFGFDAIWVSSRDGMISRLDPTTGAVAATGKAGSRAEQLRTGLEAVWVRVDAPILVRMDPATLEVTATYDLPSAPIPGGGFAVGEGAVWAANFGQGTIWRIAP